MQAGFAARLRELRERNSWTVADMAERTGIPKQTLDKYLLRSGASLPSFEALVALSRGLGVSLDWLVFGVEIAGETAELIAERATRDVSLLYFESFVFWADQEGKKLVEGDLLVGMSPEEWAAELGERTGKKARELVAQGVTKEDLLVWRHKLGERVRELTSERISRLLQAYEARR